MKVAIIGAGATAMIVADLIAESHNFKIAGFIGPAEEKERCERLQKQALEPHPFLGDYSIMDQLHRSNINRFIAAISDNSIREKMYYRAMQLGLNPINAISKHAIIHSSVKIGSGVIISPGTVVSPGVTIEDNVLIDASVVVGINSIIGPHSHSAAGVTICGACHIEKNVTLKPNCVIEPWVLVGKNQTVESAKVVSEDLAGLLRGEG